MYLEYLNVNQKAPKQQNDNKMYKIIILSPLRAPNTSVFQPFLNCGILAFLAFGTPLNDEIDLKFT